VVIFGRQQFLHPHVAFIIRLFSTVQTIFKELATTRTSYTVMFNCLISSQVKKRQMRIRTVLEAKKIPFEVIDVAQDQDALERMRQVVDDEEALAPQIVNGDEYCGNFEEFEAAIEAENLEEFLKLK